MLILCLIYSICVFIVLHLVNSFVMRISSYLGMMADIIVSIGLPKGLFISLKGPKLSVSVGLKIEQLELELGTQWPAHI